MYAAIIAASASLLAPAQEAIMPAQFVPRLNLCSEIIEGEKWRIYGHHNYYQITPLKIIGSGRWRKPSFYVRYADNGNIRYQLSLGTAHIPSSYLNHFVYADGELVHTAGHNKRSNGNDRAIGSLTSDELARMKSARRVEIKITESSVLEPDRFYGSVTMDLRGLSRIEPIGRRLMKVVQKKKATTNCK
ncbi:MAG: hypothetical protein V2I43_27330 [Parvularcula sp.]|jgi:hypothetical protein|nr:hypothetical protein [Parvularcula sp.]